MYGPELGGDWIPGKKCSGKSFEDTKSSSYNMKGKHDKCLEFCRDKLARINGVTGPKGCCTFT